MKTQKSAWEKRFFLQYLALNRLKKNIQNKDGGQDAVAQFERGKNIPTLQLGSVI